MKGLLIRSSLLVFAAYLLFRSAQAFQKIASGTGSLWGEYSFNWALAFLLYCLFCVFLLILFWGSLFNAERTRSIFGRLPALRERLGYATWLFVLVLLILPPWLFQYTVWGRIFQDIYLRGVVWFLSAMGIAFFIRKGADFWGWKECAVAALLTSSVFVIVSPFQGVTDYPFSLGWSEGNRLWDYSIMFGRRLYDYPADREIPVFLDAGRQFIGGVPFLIPDLTISMARFWLGVTVTLPYVLLGLAVFHSDRKDWLKYLLASLWVLIFLKQGPIHPPLVLCAVVVALLWRAPLWLAVPLIALTGYAAQLSRFTWLFAPGLWIGMLELAGAELHDGKLSRNAWTRALLLGLTGMAGGYFGQKIVDLFTGNASVTVAPTVEGVSTLISSQPLLWYRLFPNATYGMGILVGLMFATLPLIVLLSYLAISRIWKLNIWQALAILAPLGAFLVVGLIVSTKIGGGGDLHNMDMFLIGLLFTAVMAWQKGGKQWFATLPLTPIGLKIIVLLLFIVPGLQSLQELQYTRFVENVTWLATLTDAPNKNAVNDHPSPETADALLEKIRREVAQVRSEGGEILFMDQRQLLTFGYIQNVPLVPDYDKKLLMDQALGANAAYFKNYYADLAAGRFDLIVTEILRTPVKDSSYVFGEENNAWVEWVSIPTLCYYEPKATLSKVGVQLLVPRADTTECADLLPEGTKP